MLNNFDAFCFDLDGTIFIGDDLLPGAKEFIELLRVEKKKILFITNSPTQTRNDCKIRLERLGIQVDLEEILTAPYIAATYFKEQTDDARIYIIGEPAIAKEFDPFSLHVTENPYHATHVLVGLDRKFTYEKLNAAMNAVRNGAKIVITNPDPFCPVPGGFISDTMAIAKAIEVASGVSISEVIGKPSKYYAEKIAKKLNISKSKCLVIGDRLETDILLGKLHNFSTCLVLTGVTDVKEAKESNIKPDFIVKNLIELQECEMQL